MPNVERLLAPSSSCTHYVELNITLDGPYQKYQFFMLKNNKAFMPIVGFSHENAVTWIEVVLTDFQKSMLKEI